MKPRLRLLSLCGIALTAALALGPAVAANAAPAGCVTHVLKAGSTDSFCVGKLQSLLNYDTFRYGQPTITVDKQFGATTEGRVRAVQSASWITSDGIVGRATWSILCQHNSADWSPMQKSVGCATL
jgi:peptidoglycan hydrolase-like protein with peptidoglycan-binding domain